MSQKISIPNRTSVEVELYGQKFIIKKPSVAKIEELQDKLDGIDDKSGKLTLNTIGRWLMDLGISKDILKEIELEHLFVLVQELSGVKKN